MTPRLVTCDSGPVIEVPDMNCRKGFSASAPSGGSGPTGPTATDTHPQHRSIDMHLLVQELSRDRMRQAQRDMEAIRLAARLRTARKQRDHQRTVRH